jgi:AcrR family transcriptional regulator
MAVESRAVSIEQKKERQQQIIATTRKFFEQSDFHSISMEQIAREAGLAKGTVFFYFKTKEELFLALTQEEIARWHDIMDKQLADLAKNGQTFDVESFADFLSTSVAAHTTLLRLVNIIGSVLEHNISFTAALEFKKFLRRRILATGTKFEQCLPVLKEGEGVRLWMAAYFLMSGIVPMAFPSGPVPSVFQEPGMEIFQIDFRQNFREMLLLHMHGWLKA